MAKNPLKRTSERKRTPRAARKPPQPATVVAEPAEPARRREGSAASAPTRPEAVRPKRRPIRSGRKALGETATLMAMPLAVYRTDAEGWIEFFNPAAAELWGRRPAPGAVRWCGSWRLYWPDGRAMAPEETPMALCLGNEAPGRPVEAVIERPDGVRVAVLNHPALLRDASGRILGAVNVQAAIGDGSGAALETRRLAAIVEGSDDAIISKTLGGIVTSWNSGATRMFGYSAPEMIGQPIARIVPDELRRQEEGFLRKLARAERIDHFDTIRVGKDGGAIAVSLSVSPLRDARGAVVGASTIARDVTERKRAESALREATEASQRARLEAESANLAKTEFLAVMSHEIRTPLNSISGFVDLLTDTTELTPKQRRYVELVRAANAVLLTVVNDILDFSKVEAGRLDLDAHPFAVAALIEETVAIVRPSAAANRLDLTASIDPAVPEWAMGDPARLRQVLLNLLNNAVKFTEEGSIAVDVRPETGADRPERIRFSVTDTGAGIPADQQHRLFKPFSQADNSVSRRHGGAGLGLAICKRLVELMDGEIGIVSEVGVGSTVWFTASTPTATKPAPAPETTAPAPDPMAQKARILVIDDIDTNLEIVEAYLLDRGYLVDCVGGALEAIQMLGANPYDLILMDIQMPVMDGVAATRKIRALPAPIRDIPIIAMTGAVLPQQVRSFLEAGMNDHVGKPIERAKLYSNIVRWLPKTEAARARARTPTPAFDKVRLDEFVLVVGAEKAERIAGKFLVSLEGAFNTGFADARREAHGLINTAGVIGLEAFVAACRRAMEIPASDIDGDRERAALEDLRRARAAARQTLAVLILPKLGGSPLRSAS